MYIGHKCFKFENTSFYLGTESGDQVLIRDQQLTNLGSAVRNFPRKTVTQNMLEMCSFHRWVWSKQLRTMGYKSAQLQLDSWAQSSFPQLNRTSMLTADESSTLFFEYTEI